MNNLIKYRNADKEFWYEWRDFNKYVAERSDGRVFNNQPWPMIRNEQDTWNHIFHFYY